MKLLLCAIRTASLTDMELAPLLSTVSESDAAPLSSLPRSSQRNTGSGPVVSHALLKKEREVWGSMTYNWAASSSAPYTRQGCRN